MRKDLLWTFFQLKEAKVTSLFLGQTIKQLKLTLRIFPLPSVSLHLCHTRLCLVKINFSRTSIWFPLKHELCLFFLHNFQFLLFPPNPFNNRRNDTGDQLLALCKISHQNSESLQKDFPQSTQSQIPTQVTNPRMLSIRTKEVVILVFKQSWFMLPVILLEGERNNCSWKIITQNCQKLYKSLNQCNK